MSVIIMAMTMMVTVVVDAGSGKFQWWLMVVISDGYEEYKDIFRNCGWLIASCINLSLHLLKLR